MSESIKALFINAGTFPLEKIKMEMNSESIKTNILEAINKMGNRGYALLKFKDRYFVCEHKEQSGVSTEYKRREVTYHTYMKELA
jgi:hypothetical protein